MKKLTTVFFLLLLSPIAAHAAGNKYQDSPIYFGVNYGNFKDLDSGPMIQVGYDFSDYLAVEGQVGAPNEKEGTVSGYPYTLRFTYASALVRGNLRFDRHTLFAYAGATYGKTDTKIDLGTSTESDSTSETKPTYGFGIDLYGNNTTALTFKWMRVYDDTDGDIDATFLGITHYLSD